MSCATCHRLPAPPSPALLFQIDRGYAASWGGLQLSVRLEMGQWTVRVRSEETSANLHTAYRYSLNTARQCAAEFAIFDAWGPDSRLNASQLSSQLNWKMSN